MSTQADGGLVPHWTFGDRIRKIRRELHLTQGDFAESIGQGDKALSAWESGLREPRDVVAIAKRIQIRHGVPAVWTLGIDEGLRPDGPDGGSGVRQQGLEPRTR